MVPHWHWAKELVGGPLFLERVMLGAALDMPESNRHVANQKIQDLDDLGGVLGGRDDGFINSFCRT